MLKSEFIIREPKIKWANKIAFALIFAIFFTFIFYLISNSFFEKKKDSIPIIIFLIWLLGVLIVFLIPIVSRHHIHLNFSELKIKHSYSIGAYHYHEKWQNLEDLQYISVFNSSGGYEVNLWYKKNQQLNLFLLEDFDEVLNKAFLFADKLNIKLLDARKRGSHKWINKTVFKETGKIIHLD